MARKKKKSERAAEKAKYKAGGPSGKNRKRLAKHRHAMRELGRAIKTNIDGESSPDYNI